MPDKQPISPKEFLKHRRPERFSDSVRLSEPVVDRAQLEYHLDTLTSRNQETDFQEFARALAQKEICPNLRPQTGPTGGGDSKVDSETYPVAHSLAMAWYIGEARQAGTERWAFAMSAKKDWRPKLRSDIAKIAETGRGYAKAFFISNQFISDRTRADLEDSLSREHGLAVTILDRTWVLDSVFDNNRQELVREHLGIGSVREERRLGPRDTARQRALDAAEQRLSGAVESGDHSPSIVDDAIYTVELARELELKEVEIRGRIERALSLADEYGASDQRVRARYQAAWTAFWWLEDPKKLNNLYSQVETLVRGTRNARELELLTNLWNLLPSAVRRGALTPEDALLEERRLVLLEEVDRLGSDRTRPSAALWARSLSLQLRLSKAVQDGDEKEKELVLGEYLTLFDESAGLVGFPLRSLMDLLVEVSHVFEDTRAADRLFARLEEVAAEREGQVEAARIQLARGAKQLDAGRPIKAIASTGRALARLAKHESREDLVRALYLIGAAYHRSGLLWAARGSLVTAASYATAEYWTYGEINNAQLACYERIRLIELELGRIPQALAWHEVCATWAEHLREGESLPDKMSERHATFDACLGIRLLNLGPSDLTQLGQLPDALDTLGLFNAAVALRWALGEEYLPEEFLEVSGDNPQAYFEQWVDQPASQHLQKDAYLGYSEVALLESRVLGCRVRVTTENSSPCRELAESFLGGLEALLATGMLHGMVAREPLLAVHVKRAKGAGAPLSTELVEDRGRAVLVISTPGFSMKRLSPDEQGRIRDGIFEGLALVIGRIVIADDFEEKLRQVLADEEAISRAMSFTSSIVTLSNVLGHEPRFELAAWLHETATRYELTRQQGWREGAGSIQSASGQEALSPGSGQPPSGLHEHARLSHDEIRTVSLIREELWNKANWDGTVFRYTLGGDDPPVLALLFRNPRAATEIFEGLRDDLEREDGKTALRVSIIRGISATHPAHYRVLIGSEPVSALRNGGASERSKQFMIFLSRCNTMEPGDTKNLEGFLGAYGRSQRFLLTPAAFFPGEAHPRLRTGLGIELESIVVREAWEVGSNDLEMVAIRASDDPIVPDDLEGDPPVLEVLRLMRQKHRPAGDSV